MFDVVLVCALLALVVSVALRALKGPPPHRAVSFLVIAAVSAAIHLGFHAAATAAPSMPSAAALVLAGWSNFGLWCAWLSRAPARGRWRDSDDDDPGGGGGGGPGGGEGGGPGTPGPAGDGGTDWDRFEREFADYVNRRRETLTRG
jgi:hypothetical protein